METSREQPGRVKSILQILQNDGMARRIQALVGFANGDSDTTRWSLAAWGAFLLLLGVYLFGHPGRIDVIDGQLRFDVAKSMLDHQGPVISDPYLSLGKLPTDKRSGKKYSYYTAPASILGTFPMAISRSILGHTGPSDRFSFSLVNAFVGALIGPLLLAFYRRLNVALVPALAWTMVFGLATLWWPGSETTFDQCQHGVVLLAMLLFAFETTRSGRMRFAAVTGLLAGLLLNYRTPFAVIFPLIPIYWWLVTRAEPKAAHLLFVKTSLFVSGIGIGLAAYVGYNYLRFGQMSLPSFQSEDALGNPLAGFVTLALSPGKGLLWYSPPLIFAIFGFPGFASAQNHLAKLVLAVTVLQVGLMSSLIYASGDWCWGPRYLLPLMPIWALALPFAPRRLSSRFVVATVVAIGIAVQLLGISVDTDRFFWKRRFNTEMTPDLLHFSWLFYMRHSQLLSRPGELTETLEFMDRTYPNVNYNPYHDATYLTSGPLVGVILPKLADALARLPAQTSPTVRLQFERNIFGQANRYLGGIEQQNQMFYLPRPWWGWINRVPVSQRPINPTAFLILCSSVTISGILLSAASVGGKRQIEAPEASFDLGRRS